MHKCVKIAGLLMMSLVVCLTNEIHAQTNTFPETGNVGIGTAFPKAKLTVGGLGSSYRIQLDGNISNVLGFGNGEYSGTTPVYDTHIVNTFDPGSPSGNQMNFNVSSGINSVASDVLVLQGDGSIGINTASPKASLTVGTLNGVKNGSYRIQLDGNVSNILGFGNGEYSGATPLYNTTIVNRLSTSAYGNSMAFNISSGGGTVANNVLVLNGSGRVGIGTPDPARMLHIAGDVRIDGKLYFGTDPQEQSAAYAGILCGGDYAEAMDVTGDRTAYAPGDVLVLDRSNPGRVLKSIEPYSTKVAGIYSTKPGTVGRRQITAKSDSEVPMAMVGVVPTKVTAENGSIDVGDLLVSSSMLGYAMKGTDRSRMLGAVIGKAMGRLESGIGTIEVLVSLQ